MNKLTQEQKDEMIKKYRSEGYNIVSVGRLYGVSADIVRLIFQKAGVVLKTASEAGRRHALNQNYFDKIDSEEKAYFLGLLYADGYNNEKRGEIHLSLQAEDRPILDRLREATQSGRSLLFIDLSNRGKNQKDVYRFDISSRQISQRLKELGCPQAKSFILKFPNEFQVPNKLLKHFIRGYFDGDGCFVDSVVKKGYHQHSIGIVSTEDFCRSLQYEVFNILGITSFLSIRHKERNNSTRNFHISGNKQVAKFLDWLYDGATIFLNRKREKYALAKKVYVAKMAVK